jgi:hypothetical protein
MAFRERFLHFRQPLLLTSGPLSGGGGGGGGGSSSSSREIADDNTSGWACVTPSIALCYSD